ncbi:MAG: hypothetical protein LBP58_05990 [Azoarcus sp.]|jgi:hypothetical protein|nr:hypothetical protein [Azoarcus sp.]
MNCESIELDFSCIDHLEFIDYGDEIVVCYSEKKEPSISVQCAFNFVSFPSVGAAYNYVRRLGYLGDIMIIRDESLAVSLFGDLIGASGASVN